MRVIYLDVASPSVNGRSGDEQSLLLSDLQGRLLKRTKKGEREKAWLAELRKQEEKLLAEVL